MSLLKKGKEARTKNPGFYFKLLRLHLFAIPILEP